MGIDPHIADLEVHRGDDVGHRIGQIRLVRPRASGEPRYSQPSTPTRPLQSPVNDHAALVQRRRQNQPVRLSPQHVEVLRPGQMVVNPTTAKTHVNRIMTKLQARDRAQLMVLAYQSGLVSRSSR